MGLGSMSSNWTFLRFEGTLTNSKLFSVVSRAKGQPKGVKGQGCMASWRRQTPQKNTERRSVVLQWARWSAGAKGKRLLRGKLGGLSVGHKAPCIPHRNCQVIATQSVEGEGRNLHLEKTTRPLENIFTHTDVSPTSGNWVVNTIVQTITEWMESNGGFYCYSFLLLPYKTWNMMQNVMQRDH